MIERVAEKSEHAIRHAIEQRHFLIRRLNAALGHADRVALQQYRALFVAERSPHCLRIKDRVAHDVMKHRLDPQQIGEG